MADIDETARGLADLALLKAGQPPTPEALAAYAMALAPIPQEFVDATIARLKYTGGDFFPSLAGVVKALVEVMTRRDVLLAPDDAWALARRAASRYQPQTRPRVPSGNPAVDAAIRELGGPEALLFTDAKGAEIQRGRFLVAYANQLTSPHQLGWALQHPPVVPQLVPGVELPDREIARLEADARALGVTPPALIDRIKLGIPERGIIPDGTLPPPPALPARLSEPLTPERRVELDAETRESLRRMVERTGLLASEGTEPIGATQIHQPGVTVRRWNDGEVRFGRPPGLEQKEDWRASERAEMEHRERGTGGAGS